MNLLLVVWIGRLPLNLKGQRCNTERTATPWPWLWRLAWKIRSLIGHWSVAIQYGTPFKRKQKRTKLWIKPLNKMVPRTRNPFKLMKWIVLSCGWKRKGRSRLKCAAQGRQCFSYRQMALEERSGNVGAPNTIPYKMTADFHRCWKLPYTIPHFPPLLFVLRNTGSNLHRGNGFH